MATININEMKGSQIHRIVAAVLDVMEQAGFNTSARVDLKEVKDTENWMMTFEKNGTSLDELAGIRQNLGTDFQISILPRSKDRLDIRLEAKNAVFLSLLNKKE